MRNLSTTTAVLSIYQTLFSLGLSLHRYLAHTIAGYTNEEWFVCGSMLEITINESRTHWVDSPFRTMI